ncbi:MAG: glycoside hydrolase family 95 protein [Bacteroidota bacterium]
MKNSNLKSIALLQLLFSLFLLSSLNLVGQTSQSIDDILWFNKPAKEWEEALPLGNGRLGVMVFGKTSEERIQLNDDSMWPADLGWGEAEGNKQDIQDIRELLFSGKNAEADSLFVDKFSRKTILRSHQTLGDLYIDFNHKRISDYRRELNISKAIAKVSYKADGDLITEKVFVSHPHRAIIIEITSEAKHGLNGKIRLNRPEDEGYPTAITKTNENNLLFMQGEVTQRGGKFDSKPVPILEGVKFETCLKINNVGGEILRGEDYLELKNVEKATFYLVSNTSFYHENYSEQNKIDLAAIQGVDVKILEKEHIEDYQDLYSRVDLKLTDNKLDIIPTDKRVMSVKKGESDLGLEALLFKYGRYLLISSSREGTNPANLQGIWNPHISAPWNADYHLNINLQMNYWLANVTNLGELNMPLFDYIDKLIENGKITAKNNFGCRGAFIPHATDIWAPTWLRAPTAYWGCSMGGGGWLVQHYWQYFVYTRDKSFLKKRAFPAITEVAKFYSDWIIEDPRDKSLISVPSTSPENRFINSAGEPVATCLGSAMDQQVIAEVFDNYIEASAIIGHDDELLKKIKQQRPLLRSGFVIGSDGRILEWDREYEEYEPGHRHISHLYGFYPGISITKDKSPKLFDAVKKTLNHRLENGGAGPGWSRAWLINSSARLLDGDMAHDHVQKFLEKSVYSNLLDVHPPFQIDGNFGYTAGIAEMLLQSHEENLLRILPALPSNWEKGYVKGIQGRGGLTVDILWNKNMLDKVIIRSKFDRNFNFVYKDKVIPVEIKKGEVFTYLNKSE